MLHVSLLHYVVFPFHVVDTLRKPIFHCTEMSLLDNLP